MAQSVGPHGSVEFDNGRDRSYASWPGTRAQVHTFAAQSLRRLADIPTIKMDLRASNLPQLQIWHENNPWHSLGGSHCV